jgi:adenylate cyclase
MSFRIGVHVGDVMVRGADLLGDGVNVAARLQALAHPGGLCLSGEAHQYARKVLPLAYEDLGHQTVHNIEEPIRAYAVEPARLLGTETGPPEESSRNLSLTDRPSIAVLPFENISGSPEDEYFADGITEDLITALTRVRWVQVVARNSVFGYKRKADIRQVARDLRATYMLEGSVRREAWTGQTDGATDRRHQWDAHVGKAV